MRPTVPAGLKLQHSRWVAELGETGGVDYVKMDVEGAERELLRSPGWNEQVRCIKVEVDEPYTLEECVTDLRRLGFTAQIDQDHWACVSGVRS
jgi:hypothetical protein